MEFKPLYDKVIAIIINEDLKQGNIYLPNNNNNLIKAKIIKIGFGKMLNNGEIKKLFVKQNDIILFKDSFNIEKYKINNITYYILKEEDILTIII